MRSAKIVRNREAATKFCAMRIPTTLLAAAAAVSAIYGPARAQEIGVLNTEPSIAGGAGLELIDDEGTVLDAVPFVKVDKSRFADGENVFFWVGIRPTGKRKPIPKQFRNSCRLYITRPDGSTKIEKSGWPSEGPEGSTWQGGSGLGEAAQPGTYKIVFEFAGQKSAPAEIVVEHLPILQKIHAQFTFGATGTDTPVTFEVKNNSEQTIRFPRINGGSTAVWTHFDGEEHQGSVQMFYPTDTASNTIGPSGSPINFTNFTWDLAKSVPTVTLKPGEKYQQTLSLQAAAAAARQYGTLAPGKYKVLFGTTLQVLLGEPDGNLVKLEAVRLPVENTAICSVSAP